MNNNNSLIFFNLLLSLFLVFYFMGQEPYEYLFSVYIGTIVVVVFLCLLIFILNLILKPFDQKLKKISDYFVVFIFIYFLFLDTSIINSTLFKDKLVTSYIMAYIIQTLVFCIWWYNVIKLFIPVLIGLITFNIGIYSLATLYNINLFNSNSASLSYGNMIHKPNIYLIVLESYQGNEAMKKLYHYDNKEFITELKKMNFTTYQNVYSNAPDTKSSLSSMFSINDLNNVHPNEIDKMLREPNKYKTTATLIENGYDVEYFFPTNYLYSNDSRCIDKYYINSLLFQDYLKRTSWCGVLKYKTFSNFVSQLEDRLPLSSAKPFLFITKIGGVSENDFTYSGGVMHIPNKYRRTNKTNLLPKLRKEYIEEVKKENILLKRVLKKILEIDPSGLIVLVGDHGGDFFEIYDRNYSDKILPFLKKNKITKNDFLLDFFNVFLAIKWPDYINNNNKRIYNTAELFKLIFERLIPNLDIPTPSYQLFDYDGRPLTDIFIERNK